MSKYLPSMFDSGVQEYVGARCRRLLTLAVTVKELDPLLQCHIEGLQMAPARNSTSCQPLGQRHLCVPSRITERGRLLATRLKMNMVNSGRPRWRSTLRQRISMRAACTRRSSR